MHLGIHDFEFDGGLPGYFEVLGLLVWWFGGMISSRLVEEIMYLFVF